MHFPTKSAASYYRKVCHSREFARKLVVVKSRRWDCDSWSWMPCWCVVLK